MHKNHRLGDLLVFSWRTLASHKRDLPHDAFTSVGFFYLEDHSIPQPLLDEVLEQSRQLFALPIEQKETLSDPILQRGYTRFEEETLDPINQKDEIRRKDITLEMKYQEMKWMYQSCMVQTYGQSQIIVN